VYNYCPFLTEYGRCSVYDHRPPICREFGSSPLAINYCPNKSSRYDILKTYLKAIPLGMYRFYKNLLISKFSKTVPA